MAVGRRGRGKMTDGSATQLEAAHALMWHYLRRERAAHIKYLWSRGSQSQATRVRQ